MSFSAGGSLLFSGASTASMGASVTSDVLNTANVSSVFIQLLFKTGTSPTGTFTLEVSGNGTDFSMVTDSDQAITDVGTHCIDLPLTGAPYTRVKYTRTSGTATLSGTFIKKGV